MTDNPHFAFPASWDEAAALVPFEPFTRDELGGRPLVSLAVFLRDHKLRDVPPGERSLEAYYDGFVFSQSRPGAEAARQRAFEISYGQDPYDIDLGDTEPGDTEARPALQARAYELGPDPEPDDPGPRMPAVLAWADGELLCLIASDTLEASELIAIGRSLYAAGDGDMGSDAGGDGDGDMGSDAGGDGDGDGDGDRDGADTDTGTDTDTGID